jgi:hypothetical protein
MNEDDSARRRDLLANNRTLLAYIPLAQRLPSLRSWPTCPRLSACGASSPLNPQVPEPPGSAVAGVASIF